MNALGVILAGGQAQRMGGIDKGRLKIGDASILEIIIKCLNFQQLPLTPHFFQWIY